MTKNEIISNLFLSKNFCECISKMEPDHLQEDLKSEVILIVCEMPEEKIVGLHERKELEFFTVRIILNLIKSNTSPFTKKYRQAYVNLEFRYSPTASFEQNTDINAMAEKAIYKHQIPKYEPSDLNERKLREQLEDIALSEIDNLYWYDAEMIRLYLKLGNFRAIETLTGIPFISCYKNIQKSLGTLKKKAVGECRPVWSKEELAFIQNK